MLSLIVAYDLNYGIGINNKLPWSLSDDLRHFKNITKNKTIIMGRGTFDSIGKKPLPMRRNIVLSRNTHNQPSGNYELYNNLQTAISKASLGSSDEIIIIGGAQLYEQSIHLVNKMYITVVNTIVESDTSFPKWNKDNWILSKSKLYDKNKHNEYAFRIDEWIKKLI